jgi:UDP-N-acetylmuramoylalanine--D-glutamate ligase
MGVTGLSCARFLLKQGVGFRLIDDRITPPLLEKFVGDFADADIRTGRFDEAALQGISRLILSPGVSHRHPFVQLAAEKNIEVIGDIELFARHANAPVIAITGSNGKSTVTTLAGEMLKAAAKQVEVGGNLGVPALDLLRDSAPDFYLLELSSFQLDTTTSLALRVAVLLNITEDHMDRYRDMDDYAASKARILNRAEHAVFNRDDPVVVNVLRTFTGEHTAITLESPAAGEFGLLEHNGKLFLAYGEQTLVAVDDLLLQGRHNWLNALAALAIMHTAGIILADTITALKVFKGLPHRCQLVLRHNNIAWVNDSKATNIGAAKAAIGSMPGSIVLIAGGDGKGADFSGLRETVDGKVKAAILLGKDAGLLEAALKNIVRCVRVENMQVAVEQAAVYAEPNDTVLLAPACASLDMYTNYMARGDDFSRCVLDLIEGADRRRSET